MSDESPLEELQDMLKADGQWEMSTDDLLIHMIRQCDEVTGPVVTVGRDAFRTFAVHTLGLRQGIRNIAEHFPYDSQLRQDVLKLIGEEAL